MGDWHVERGLVLVFPTCPKKGDQIHTLKGIFFFAFLELFSMLNVSQSESNMTSAIQKQNLLRIALISTLSTVPSVIFLYINGTILFTLRSKPVFRDTCRYVLLYNLLLADTVQLAQSQVQFLLSVCRVKLVYSLKPVLRYTCRYILLYNLLVADTLAVCQLLFLLSVCRITLTYPVCGTLTVFANLTNVSSPLTLVVMSVERCIAVCMPLRHAAIVTIRNTGLALLLVWTISSLHNMCRVFLLLDFPFVDLESLQMRDLCSDLTMLLGSKSKAYDNVFNGFLFVSAALVIISSYIGVIIAARSASTGKTSALKARNTLMLHLVQLCLSLSSTIYNPMLIALLRILQYAVFIRLHKFLYVLIILFPRCLSSLIYGLRDQTIRPVLLGYLCCRLNPKIAAVSG
uniref:G-protein coupled receptors family 1 profile domain-containing protein n=1 Tax=Cyprinodon variegatus TaxID=28743 RepID=A0A3Q2E983_CYPVA